MLLAQDGVLKVFGLIPLTTDNNKVCEHSTRRKVLSYLLTAVAVTLLIGTSYSTCFIGTIFFYSLSHPQIPTDSSTPAPDTLVLRVMQLVPYVAINARALLVISFLFFKRKSWAPLMRESCEFMRTCFPLTTEWSIVNRMRRASVILGVLTVVLHAVWEYGDWKNYLDGTTNITMTSDNAAEPLPIKYFTYQYVSVWVAFSTLPFILSQQVFLTVIILAMVLEEATKKLLRLIREETLYYENRRSASLPLSEKEIIATDDKVTGWEVYHMGMLRFCSRVVKFFSLSLFVIFGMDFITLIGFTSVIVKNHRSDGDSYIYLIGSTFVFLSYGTVFLFPLVAVYEKGIHLSFVLHRLTFAIKQCLAKDDYEKQAIGDRRLDPQCYASPAHQLLKKLKNLEATFTRHVCEFHGAEMLFYTRGFIAKTCTFLVSFMVLAREFFVKEQAAVDVEKENTNTSLILNLTITEHLKHSGIALG